jgi:hypothetical protein
MLSHNLSHWMCLLFGVLLVVVALASRLGQPTTLATDGRVRGESMLLRRAALVLVGIVGMLYGAYRITH